MSIISAIISAFFEGASGDAERIFHGRGHCYAGVEGLSIDFYPPAVLVTLFCEYRSELIDQIVGDLKKQNVVNSIVIQKRFLPKAPSEVIYGELPENHIVIERGAKYLVELNRTQNSGLFLDMSEGRRWINENAKNKRVLNLFSFTCSISVAALMGNASHVVNYDMARGVLNVGRINHRINDLDMNRVEFFAYDILKSWGRIKKKGPYDLVVIDPPSFQKGSFVAEKDYRKVVRRIAKLLKPKGQVLAALNSPELNTKFILDMFELEAPHLRFIKRIENPNSFPDIDSERSLKLMLFEVSDC